MSAPATTRQVAVFTLFLVTAWLAATTAASAMRPEPPASATRGHSHHAPAAAAGSGTDLFIWLLTAIAVAGALVVAARVVTMLRRRRLHVATHATS